MTDALDDDELDRLWTRRYVALHRTQLAVRYHQRREGFFDSLDRFTTAITALSATAAAAVIYQKSGSVPGSPGSLELVLTGLAAVMAAVAVSYSPGARARLHGQLASDFRKLWAEMVGAGEEWSAEQCDKFEAKLLLAESSEPPAMAALVTQCENEIALAEGQPRRIRVLGWRGWLMHFWNFDATGLQLIDPEKADKLLPPQPPESRPSGDGVTSGVGQMSTGTDS
jgi:hypothetical protein